MTPGRGDTVDFARGDEYAGDHCCPAVPFPAVLQCGTPFAFQAPEIAE
jgi:hypothetical protein